jgi:hypothetical protein
MAAGYPQGPIWYRELCFVSVERLCTSNLFCKTILHTTVSPTPTLFSRTSKPKQTKISSRMLQSIAEDLLVAIRVLSFSTQLCRGRDVGAKWKYRSQGPLGGVLRKLEMQYR